MSGIRSFRYSISAAALFSLASATLFCSAVRADDAPAGAGAVICAALSKTPPTAIDEADKDAVKSFYLARQCRPIWVDERGPTRAAKRAIDEIGHAADWGLEGNDFQLSAATAPMPSGVWTSAQTAAAEFEITQKILRYARQAQGGRIAQPSVSLSSYLDRQPTVISSADVLARAALASDPGDLLRSYQPPQDQFLKLKALLAKLRGVAGDSKTVTISANGPDLKIGDRGAEVGLLKQRLRLNSGAGDDETFDAALDAAVRAFQKSAGLFRDGIVGPMTRAALTGGATVGNRTEKIAAVIANMEEWRWMPRDLGATHIMVNIPSFSIALSRNDKPIFEERVVVGTQATQTPIFSKDMTTVVLRPQWFLPPSIKATALSSGRSIESQGFLLMRNGRVVNSWRVNWSAANVNEYAVFQPSGDDNALGLVKFLFPNKHSVYLHDTPSRYLFAEPVRLFSHGCMRVQNPQVLAQTILDIDRGEGALNVSRLVRKGAMNNQFVLATPIPVHVGYFTVWVADDGTANYYKDYYGHQQRITLALAGKWNQIDITREPTAAEALALAGIQAGKANRSKKADDDDDDAQASKDDAQTTKTVVNYRRYNDSVGDMIRRSLSD